MTNVTDQTDSGTGLAATRSVAHETATAARRKRSPRCGRGVGIARRSDELGHRGQAGRRAHGHHRAPRRGPPPRRGRAGRRQDAAGQDPRALDRLHGAARAVHPRPAAERHHRRLASSTRTCGTSSSARARSSPTSSSATRSTARRPRPRARCWSRWRRGRSRSTARPTRCPPFMVMATQNPIEMEGTYPLPEAQRDRFMARISMGYPSARSELDMLDLHGGVVAARGPPAGDRRARRRVVDDRGRPRGPRAARPSGSTSSTSPTPPARAPPCGSAPRRAPRCTCCAPPARTPRSPAATTCCPTTCSRIAVPVLAHRLIPTRRDADGAAHDRRRRRRPAPARPGAGSHPLSRRAHARTIPHHPRRSLRRLRARARRGRHPARSSTTSRRVGVLLLALIVIALVLVRRHGLRSTSCAPLARPGRHRRARRGHRAHPQRRVPPDAPGRHGRGVASTTPSATGRGSSSPLRPG